MNNNLNSFNSIFDIRNANIKEIDRLISREKELGGTLSFTEEAGLYENIINIINDIPQETFESLPLSELVALDNSCKNLLKVLSNISNFEIRNNRDPKKVRDDLKSVFSNNYATLHRHLLPIRGISQSQKVEDISNHLNALRVDILSIKESLNTKPYTSQIKSMEENLISTMKKADEKVNSIKRAQDALAQDKTDRTTQESADLFKDEAGNFSSQRSKDMKAIGLFSLLILLYAIAMTFGVDIGILKDIKMDGLPSWLPIAQLLTTRAVILGLLLYLLSLSVKKYLASEHNYTTNIHRSNALYTAPQLASSSEQPEIVIQHASKCIFEHQDTGFLKGQSSDQNISISELIPKTSVRGDLS